MISSMEEDGENLKIKLISGDIRMLIWNFTTNEFSNIGLMRIISLLSKTSPKEKGWREKLAHLIIYREERKLKKKKLSKKMVEERRKKLEHIFIQGERSRAKGKCRILKNPERIGFYKNGRKVTSDVISQSQEQLCRNVKAM